MSTIHRYRTVCLGSAALLSIVLVAPVAAQALDQEQNLAAAPAGPSWDDTSGYGAVEASRAAVSTVLAADPAWDTTSGYGAVELSRPGMTTLLAPAANPSQIPPDVRWAPVPALAPTANELGTALAVGMRAESAHLATIPLPGGH